MTAAESRTGVEQVFVSRVDELDAQAGGWRESVDPRLIDGWVNIRVIGGFEAGHYIEMELFPSNLNSVSIDI